MTDVVEPAGFAHLTWVHDGGVSGHTVPVTHEANDDWKLDFCSCDLDLGQWEITVYLRNCEKDGSPAAPNVAAHWNNGPHTNAPGWDEWSAMSESKRMMAVIFGGGRPDQPNLPDATRCVVDGASAWTQDLTSIGAGFIIFPDWSNL